MASFVADLAKSVRTPLMGEHAVCEHDHPDRSGRDGAGTRHADRPVCHVVVSDLEAVDLVSNTRMGKAKLAPRQVFGDPPFLAAAFRWLARAAPKRAFCVSRDEMLRLMSNTPEMSDIIVTAFAGRRRRTISTLTER